jgi:excisionase family DNA binding protein
MTDTTEYRDADTVIDAAIRDAVTMVTVEDAATLAGVSVRTIRRWIQQGHLPYTEDEQGKRVSPADVPMARERAGRGHVRGHGTRSFGHDRRHDTMATDRDTAMTAPALSSATAQLEAIRDQWLRPLVDRIEELSRENGRLEAEREALRIEIDRMRLAPNDAPQDANAAPVRDDAPAGASDSPRSGWRRWWRRMTWGG